MAINMTPITQEEYTTIYTYLRDRNVWAENIEKFDGCIVIDINGDWKHDHLRCNWLMNELGYTNMGGYILEDTGCDYYPARHFYRKDA